MFIEQHDVKVNSILGDKKFFWKLIQGKKIESPTFDYPILFGVEMEYEVITPKDIQGIDAKHLYRAQIANRMESTYKNFAIAKHDGSLDNGFEVVSVPMSMDAHREQWKPFLDVAEENGLTVRKTCGMHVHVSRELLTPLHIGKMLAFIHDKTNAAFIKTIAGRTKPIYTGKHGEYADLTPKKISEVNHHLDRYAAFNIQGSETIEFRFFKSTLSLERMLANIEFCSALISFTWPSHEGIQQIKDNGLELFSKFILENRKMYPYLAEFMYKNHYISWKKIPAKYQKKIETPVVTKVKKASTKKRTFKKSLNLNTVTWDMPIQQGIF